MNKFLIAVLSSAVLVGCGGSGGGSDTVTPEVIVVDAVDTVEDAISVDGLFLNSTGTASLIVDTKNGFVNVLESDTTEILYDIDLVSHSSSNVVNLTGVTAVTSDDVISAPVETATLTYSADGKSVTFDYSYESVRDDVTYQEVVTETFSKQSDSLSIAQIAGSSMSTLAPGIEWIIGGDGSVSVNAFCTLSGSLSPVKFYYVLNLTATGCSSDYSEFENATLTGRAYTAEYQDKSYFIGFALDDSKNNAVWDIVDLN